MTRVIVVGDSLSGKTKMLQLATMGRIPHDVFRSTQIEEYMPIAGATFCVAPGGITDHNLQQLCAGADGLVVVYRSDASIYAGRRWLKRISRLVEGSTRVPVLICCLGSASSCSPQEAGRHLGAVLREYPMAEHTQLTETSLCGTKDCVNRIVYRIRKAPPSPLVIVRLLTELHR